MDKQYTSITSSYEVLWSKGLINDLKQAATCDIRYLCRIPCDRCPNTSSKFNLEKIKISGLDNYNLQIHKISTANIFITINAEGISHWALHHNVKR
jgi:hypothetical protein